MEKRMFLTAMVFLLATVAITAQLKPGDKAPGFKLKNIDNQWVSIRMTQPLLQKNEGEHFTVAYIGAIDDNSQDANDVEEKYLANAIQSLLKGNKPEVVETKAVGCSIKFN